MSDYQPFLESNKYTRVHNYLIDSLMPVLSPTAFKVLMLIWRHTQGFTDGNGGRIESAQLAYSIIKERTGIKHNMTLANGLKELLHFGLIAITEGKEFEANSYKIILDHVAKSKSDLAKSKSLFDLECKANAKSKSDLGGKSKNDDNKRNTTTKESKEKKAPTQKALIPTSPKPKPPLSTVPIHPFVEAYVRVFNRSPNKQQRETLNTMPINERVVSVWEDTLKAWALNGWNPANVMGQLEKFNKDYADTTQPQTHKYSFSAF